MPYETVSDGRGSFTLTDLPAGTVIVSAEQSRARSVSDNPVDVVLHEGSVIEVREHRWRTEPVPVTLVAGDEQFVQLEARRSVE